MLSSSRPLIQTLVVEWLAIRQVHAETRYKNARGGAEGSQSFLVWIFGKFVLGRGDCGGEEGLR